MEEGKNAVRLESLFGRVQVYGPGPASFTCRLRSENDDITAKGGDTMAIPSDCTRHEVLVPLLPPDAFHLFTEGLTSWWPAEYTWSQGSVVNISIEPRKGGRCTEQGPYGFQCDWGRVLEWEPPKRLVFTWQIGLNREPQPDPAQASTLEIEFEPASADTTQVSLVHRDISRHGQDADDYLLALSSEYGWPFILHRFVEAAKVFDRG